MICIYLILYTTRCSKDCITSWKLWLCKNKDSGMWCAHAT